jgi:hypothetical protein
MKDAIGGYFELELTRGKEYHVDALRLNLGRTAFEYILKAKKIRKIYLPYYACKVMFAPLLKLGIEYEFYKINDDLEPIFYFNVLQENDYFLYINYFGLKDGYVMDLTQKAKKVIIDNSQSFYSESLQNTDTFYSARKFFGVPDGAYLYTNTILPEKFEVDVSGNRMQHLTGRIEKGAENAYADFKAHEASFEGQPIRQMSLLTQRLLQNIDYWQVKKTRRANFKYLNEHLHKLNQLNIGLMPESVPMVYPFLTKDSLLKKRLIEEKIFIPTYWEDVLENQDISPFEKSMVTHLVCLPIDQRIDNTHLDKIIRVIQES